MSSKILVVTYNCRLSRQEFQDTIGADASDLAAFPGLQWKIWVVDEEGEAYGGVHLFDDQASVDAYLRDVIGALAEHPAIHGVETRVFDIMADPSLVTRAPIADAVRV